MIAELPLVMLLLLSLSWYNIHWLK